MENLTIDTGIKRIMINDDPARVIEFNPKDVFFVEKFYQLIKEFEGKLSEYQQRAEQNEKVTALGADGYPVNMAERLSLLHDACDYICGRIDYVFGKDTSLKVFDGARTLEMFSEFLNGISPYVVKERSEKVRQYTNPESAKRNQRSTKGKKKK
jgi:hypothetical protein